MYVKKNIFTGLSQRMPSKVVTKQQQCVISNFWNSFETSDCKIVVERYFCLLQLTMTVNILLAVLLYLYDSDCKTHWNVDVVLSQWCLHHISHIPATVLVLLLQVAAHVLLLLQVSGHGLCPVVVRDEVKLSALNYATFNLEESWNVVTWQMMWIRSAFHFVKKFRFVSIRQSDKYHWKVKELF